MNYTQDQLKEILAKHSAWSRGEAGGSRAKLSGANLIGANLRRADLSVANLSDADLSGANLSVANLSGAHLRGANLSGANLRGTNLSGTNLSGADLRGANLSGANLRGTNLSCADLSGADIIGADLSGADLSGANLNIPVIPHIDAQILQAISRDGCALKMRDWHTCETAHCRAGWAIHLAGKAGYDLENATSPSVAGALIYAKSRPGKPVPNFHQDSETALADIKTCATQDPIPQEVA